MSQPEPASPRARGEGADDMITAALGEMQVAQRQTDTQLNMISQQVKELALANASTNAQLKELVSAVNALSVTRE